MFGLLSLYKPSGPTSRDCVNRIQRLVKPLKVGHAGTLDPIASGVLFILVGNAVRLTDEFHELDKEYVGVFQLGRSSPSVDTETPCTVLSNAPMLSREGIESILPQFLGEIDQVPPAYSAVRIDGQHAYDLARSGLTVEMPSRKVHVSRIDLLSLDLSPNTIPTMTLRITCGTGTYIRSLGRDIARALGSDAVMSSLERTRIGPFTSRKSIPMEGITDQSSVSSALVPPQQGLIDLPQFTLEPAILDRFRMGQKIAASEVPYLVPMQKILAIDSFGRLRGVLRFAPSPSPVHPDDTNGVWCTEKFFND
ncbi:tRNA pseudouridine(55) synthase TruB [Pirellulaceae bacterium SH501]